MGDLHQSTPPPTNEGRELEPERVEYARMLQRGAMTFTEIARRMRVPRQAVVDALYWAEMDKGER